MTRKTKRPKTQYAQQAAPANAHCSGRVQPEPSLLAPVPRSWLMSIGLLGTWEALTREMKAALYCAEYAGLEVLGVLESCTRSTTESTDPIL